MEYTLIIGIIAAALASMQLYFKRAVQATVKVAADEIGAQKAGSADYDARYDWKLKGDSYTESTANGTTTTNQLGNGAVAYGKNETTSQTGTVSWGLWQEKE